MERNTTRTSRTRRLAASLALSLLLHGASLLLFALSWSNEPPPPKDKIIELALVQAGEPAPEKGSAPPPPPRPVAPRPSPRVRPAPPADEGDRLVIPVPPSEPEPVPAPVPSFRDWQRAQRTSFLPTPQPLGGGDGGHDRVTSRGRDRCLPPSARSAEMVYLLFDSSGSMSSLLRSQALSCAHQYARAALQGGASIVVGNFAKTSVFTPPTRDILDVEAALRAASDKSATLLPTREMLPSWDHGEGLASDLVIISDGVFATGPEVLVWYRYFVESNAENRGIMYTVGSPGLRESVGALRSIGFDVYMYEEIR